MKFATDYIRKMLRYKPQNMEIYSIFCQKGESAYVQYTVDKGWNVKYITDPDMSKESTFKRLFRAPIRKENKHIFFYAGHGDSFSVNFMPGYHISLDDLSDMLYKYVIPELLIFDSCLTASLEALYSFKKSKYILANQLYADNVGFMSKNTLMYFDTMSLVDACLYIIAETKTKIKVTYEWNASLLRTQYIDDIMKQMNKILINQETPMFRDIQSCRITKNYNVSYLDLYLFIKMIPSKYFIGSSHKKKLLKKIKQSIMCYDSTNDKSKLYGLSITTTTRLYDYDVPYEGQKIYKENLIIQLLHHLHSI